MVDDAPLMRKVIRQILDVQGAIEVVGTAVNGSECLEMIPELKPDVITLDIDMPVMNGITAIKNIMVRHQIPIVIISSLVQDGYFAFEALRLGVMDFVPKPSKVAAENWEAEEELIRMRVRVASGMQVHRMRRVRRLGRPNAARARNEGPLPALVVMGTTLAGPNTIMHIATQLESDFPGAVIAVQEIHPRILGPFCASFNEISPLEVVPVTENCPLCAGRIYMGSLSTGLKIRPASNGSGEWVLEVNKPGEQPIDELFKSAALHFGERSCSVLLTGIGTDGASGMRRVKDEGGLTIAQAQECSVYPNLVENAVQQGVVDLLVSNHEIAQSLNSWVFGSLCSREESRERKA